MENHGNRRGKYTEGRPSTNVPRGKFKAGAPFGSYSTLPSSISRVRRNFDLRKKELHYAYLPFIRLSLSTPRNKRKGRVQQGGIGQDPPTPAPPCPPVLLRPLRQSSICCELLRFPNQQGQFLFKEQCFVKGVDLVLRSRESKKGNQGIGFSAIALRHGSLKGKYQGHRTAGTTLGGPPLPGISIDRDDSAPKET